MKSKKCFGDEVDAIMTTSNSLAEEHEKAIGVGPKMDSEYSCRSRLANTVSQGSLIFFCWLIGSVCYQLQCFVEIYVSSFENRFIAQTSPIYILVVFFNLSQT